MGKESLLPHHLGQLPSLSAATVAARGITGAITGSLTAAVRRLVADRLTGSDDDDSTTATVDDRASTESTG